MFHPLIDVAEPSPEKLTFPYHYKPHAWTKHAAQVAYAHLNRTADRTQGRLVSLLVVKGKNNAIGFYAGSDFFKTNDDFFVPTFAEQIPQQLPNDIESTDLEKATLATQEAFATYEAFRLEAKSRKSARRLARVEGTISKEILDRESVSDSATLSQLKHAYLLAQTLESALREKWHIDKKTARENAWKARLTPIMLTNTQGKSATLWDLLGAFIDDSDKINAVLASALPALIHEAHNNGDTILAMGSVWWGKSPENDTRHEGVFYGFTRERHAALLDFMLEGVALEENALAQDPFSNRSLDVVYEDQWLIAVNKPAGLLSVPGKEPITNLFTLVADYCRQKGEEALLLHRLDMATSGLLVFAKTKEAHRCLQADFARSKIEKCYEALLEKAPLQANGEIRLPLCLNPLERPRQIVSAMYGKEALTHYEVIGEIRGFTRIAFYPITGRTHQLRIHAAHALGLNSPIVGDDLYGHPAERLYLHAKSITFTHPVTRERMTLEAPAPF